MATTIRLATDENMRAISSQTLDEIMALPFVYITTDEPDAMRVWGVALDPGSIAVTVRLHPGALVAPRYMGETASRGDLLYHGAEPAAGFVPAP